MAPCRLCNPKLVGYKEMSTIPSRERCFHPSPSYEPLFIASAMMITIMFHQNDCGRVGGTLISALVLMNNIITKERCHALPLIKKDSYPMVDDSEEIRAGIDSHQKTSSMLVRHDLQFPRLGFIL